MNQRADNSLSNETSVRNSLDVKRQRKSLLKQKKKENSFCEFAKSVSKIEESLLNFNRRYKSVQKGIVISSKDSLRFVSY